MASGPAASIALHGVVFPSLDAVEAADPSAVAVLKSIRNALEKAEATNPGLTHELVDHILEMEQSKGGMDSTEKLLRAAHKEIPEYVFVAKTPELKALQEKSDALKKILSTIPDQIADRTKFLGIIRDIAAAIKDLLDAVNTVSTNNAELVAKQKTSLESHKKIFVRGSKSFSDTLKRYFKDGRSDNVYRSAHRLINQTNMILHIIKLCVQ